VSELGGPPQRHPRGHHPCCLSEPSEVCTGVCTRRTVAAYVARMTRLNKRFPHSQAGQNGRYWTRTSDPQLVQVSRPGFDGDFDARVRLAEGEVPRHATSPKYPTELLERGTRLVFESGTPRSRATCAIWACRPRPCGWRTRSQLELAIVEYVAWFNDTQLHEALGDMPPAEYEQRSQMITTPSALLTNTET